MTNILVTGGSGFIGSHLVDALVKEGFSVCVYDLMEPRTDVEYIQGSILDTFTLRRAMRDRQVVFHLAAVADVGEVEKNPAYSINVNVTGTANVLETARDLKVERIIYASTEWVYSDTNESVVDENTPIPPPKNIYTTSKLAGELMCKNFEYMYGLPNTILRFGIPYGPRARPTTVIAKFIKLASEGKSITVYGTGEQFRQFIYVEDLAEGIMKGMTPQAKNQIYNLSGSEKITVKEIAEKVKEVFKNTVIEYIPQERVADYQGKTILSEKAKKELNWEPKTKFETGLRKYIDWFMEARQ